MATDTARYDDQGEVPLGGYAALAAVFLAGTGTFALLARRRGVRLPQQVPPWDVALLGAAAYKTSRVLAKDKITSFLRAPFTRRAEEGEASEVMDEPRGDSLRRAVGDLVSCPFCVAAWTTGALVCSYAASPRLTRLVCGGCGALTVADWLQYAWTWTQRTAES
ncbi:Integral membrane protein [Streptomyces hygroscopicus subsp. limoneus]|nr:Integral membrane protein [Streptomyces hygroscopicus subsp. limoneus]